MVYFPAAWRRGLRVAVRYVSTRGEAPALGFVDVMLAGLARDGGLYVPETWPRSSRNTIAGFAGRPYAEVARRRDPAVHRRCDRRRRSRPHGARSLRHLPPSRRGAARAARRQHVRARAFSRPDARVQGCGDAAPGAADGPCAAARGERTTIVVATSGDTGGAAVEAFRGRKQVDLVVLFPNGRISDVQRRMMTTAPTPTSMRSRSTAPSTTARRS